MIAAHLDSLLFLLLVAVAALFQFLAKAAGKKGKNQTTQTSTSRTPPPIARAPRQSDEEQIRRLLEALGQPPTSSPPPSVVPRANIPPRPLAPVQPPISPLSQLRRQRPRRRDGTPEKIAPAPVRGAEEIASPKVADVSPFKVREGPPPITPPPISAPPEPYTEGMQLIVRTEGPRADIATLLASTSGLRGAMILRELLGPPRGLRMQMQFGDRML